MSNPLPLPKVEPIGQDDLFFHNMKAFIDWESEDRFMESWNWLVTEYHKKVYNLENYEALENANKQYVLREKTFLLSLLKFIKAICYEMQLRRSVDKVRAEKAEESKEFEKLLLSIIELHGININYFINDSNGASLKFTKELCSLARLTNSVRLPEAFQKQFPRADENHFNLWAK